MESSVKRVVITGMGMVNPMGVNCDEVWSNFISAKGGLRFTPKELYEEIGCPVCGMVEELNPAEILSNRKVAKLMGRDSLLAIKAAKEALLKANWTQISDIANKLGLYVSTGLTYGAQSDIFPLVADAVVDDKFSLKLFGSRSLLNCNPLLSFKILPNMPACHVSIELGLTGSNMALNPWPAQGAQVLGEAFEAISNGYLDYALVGSTESRLHFTGVQTTDQYGRIYRGQLSTEQASRPLDIGREGIVPSEGAAFVFLESFESACKRGQPIYAEVIGYGQSNALSRNVDSCCKAISESIKKSVSLSGLKVHEVDIVGTSAASSPVMDQQEGLALKSCLGTTLIWAPKAYYGELGAASFNTSLILGALTLHNGLLPPTINMEQCEFNLRILSNQPEKAIFDNFLVTAFEAGLTKASVLLGRITN